MTSKKSLESASSYSVAWITAPALQRAAALAILDEGHEKPKTFVKNKCDQNSYSWGCMSNHNVAIASLPAGVYGTLSTATTANGMLASLPPHVKFRLLVDIGTGIQEKQDVVHGDLVLSQPEGTPGGVVQYDFLKTKRGGTAQLDERKGFINSSPMILLNAIAAMQAEHEFQGSQVMAMLKAVQDNDTMTMSYSYPGSEKDQSRK